MTIRNVTVGLVAWLVLVIPAAEAREPDLDACLRFENAGGALRGWGGGPSGTFHFDGTVVHAGKGAARLERDAASEGTFTTLTKQLPIDFDGKVLELRGFLRTEDIVGYAGLWMREDGPSGVLRFDNSRNRGLRGTNDWTECSLRLPLDPTARQLFFGVLIDGQGRAWVDDLQLLVDGVPLSQTPVRETMKTVLDRDHEFDAGSGIDVTSLTAAQVGNVSLLARVWGFLKYHHPAIAAGERHWDYDLFRVLPAVLAADDPEACNQVLARWVAEVGEPAPRDSVAREPQDAQLQPRLDWIGDADLLGADLSRSLQLVHERRFAGDAQFYVTQMPVVGNPVFDRELAYPERPLPDPGYRILAVARLWNIVEYWFPYRDLIDGEWTSVLSEFLPRLVAAATRGDYRLEMMVMIACIGDTHANLWWDLDVRPPRGGCSWPVELRFVEGRAVVAAYADSLLGPASGLEIGDVIAAVDGKPVAGLIEAWSPYFCASNLAVQLRDIARALPRGDGDSEVTIERNGETLMLVVPRSIPSVSRAVTHDRRGDALQRLSPEAGYLKLSSFRIQDVDSYLEQAAGTRGLVIDIRNYPSEFAVFALGGRLVGEKTGFARFTVGDLENPGAFTWTPPVELEPASPGYAGRVAILVDERSLSQAEYTAMALRANGRAVVVGSTTAGADGNVSPIVLPGGLRTMISGIGVFYPDKTPTQRVGIVPDIVAAPTIAGIREGRDEVLEAGLRHILGPDIDEEEIRMMAARP